MFKGISPRGSSSSDLTNVSKVNFVLTWVTFQETPVVKIDFRCTGTNREKPHGSLTLKFKRVSEFSTKHMRSMYILYAI